MTQLRKQIVAVFFSLWAAAPLAQGAYSQAELDQMLAPVALYPDPLLSQVLMAATHPLQVAEAARWSRFNPGLQGDEALRAVQRENWDPSAKSLVAFPQLLARMDERLEWMRSLGEAFIAQEPQVMETVQGLRQRAQAAGNLQSSEYILVQQQGQALLVQPPNPQYVNLPHYDSRIVYGFWRWPAYPPVAWAPWPRNLWVYLSPGFFFGNFDWHHRQLRVLHVNTFYHRPAMVNRNVVIPGFYPRLEPPMSYHARSPAPHLTRIGTHSWTRSPSLPVRAAASARPPRSPF